MKKYFSLMFLCIFFSQAAIAARESSINTTLSASYSSDDNIARAANYYEVSDSILGLDAAVSYQIPINLDSFFSLKGSLAINQYQDYDKLNNNQPGVEISYHIRPGSGYSATRFSLSLGYKKRMYDSEQREGSAIDMTLGLSKRLTDRITLRAGISKEEISANEKTFEADNSRLYMDVNYRLTKNNTLYLTISDFDGDIASTNASMYAPPYYIDSVQDDAFTYATPTRYAYRIAVDAISYTLGDSYAIDSNQAIDVSMNNYDASAYGGISYKGTIYKISYLYRF